MTGKLIREQPMFQSLKSLLVAEDRSAVSVWFTNKHEELEYLRGTDADLQHGIASLLVPQGQASSFAACISSPDLPTGSNTRQLLITNDTQGNLLLLEQSSDIGLWRKTPLYAPSSAVCTEVSSYTITIKASDTRQEPISRGWVLISAASTVSAIVNGRNVLVTQAAEWYETDSKGSLDFIIPTDSLGA